MPITIAPPGRNASAAALQKIFEETQEKLIAEILRKRSKGYVDYAEVAALERVRKTLHKMVKGAEKYVPLAIEHEFYNRPESAEAYRNARESINPGRTRAVEILSDNLMGEVEEMAETAYQSTASKLFLVGRAQEDIFRESGLTKAIEASAAGRGSLTTVNEIIAAIQNTGITAFVDKAGHEWNLKAYGSMAVRTTVRQAQVAAVLTENQHDLYKIINTGVPCRWCAAYGGRVYSKSGMNKNYPPLTAAFGRIDTSGSDSIYNSFLNIHPNCQCSLVPYYEEDHSPEEVEKERLYSDPARRPFDMDYRTKAVKEAYEQKERNRAIYRANVKQYRRYLESGVPGMPKHFQTFLKHKKLNDDKYKEWMSAYRKVDKPARVKPVMPVPKLKPVKPAVQYKQFESGEAANGYFGQRPPRSLRRENREEYDRLRAEYESSAFGTWSSGLTVDEQASIANYSGDAYSGINGLLRKQMTEKMVDAWDANERLGVRGMINNLDSAIERFELKDPIRVYRTCEKDVLESLKAQPGATFRDNGYVSTSALSKKVASGNVVMEIDVPSGVGHGAWINPLSGAEDEEYEFLMPRGSEFKIKGVSERDGDTVIRMEFIGSQKQPIEFATREEVIDRWKRLGIYDEDMAKKI